MYMYVCMNQLCICVCLCIRLSVHPSICLSVCLFVCLNCMYICVCHRVPYIARRLISQCSIWHHLSCDDVSDLGIHTAACTGMAKAWTRHKHFARTLMQITRTSCFEGAWHNARLTPDMRCKEDHRRSQGRSWPIPAGQMACDPGPRRLRRLAELTRKQLI